MRTLELSGQRFGLLTAVSLTSRTKGGAIRWRCICDCGRETLVLAGNLKRGNSTNCGCVRRAKTVARCTKHDHGRRGEHTAEYRCWRGMIARCRDLDYPGYGADGITVCRRWEFGENDVHGFLCFLADMGAKPTSEHSIDRIDSGGNYESGNCRWATKVQQARNRKSGKVIVIAGRSMTVAEAAQTFDVNYATLQYRLDERGLPPEQAVGFTA